MTSKLLDEVKANSIYPDELMTDISKSTMGKTLLIAVAVHILILGVTSIGFISFSLKHGTWNPQRHKEIRAEQAAEQKAAEVAKAKAESEVAKTPAGADQATTPSATDTPAEGATVDGKSPIERKVEETDATIPPASGGNLLKEPDLDL